MAREEGAPPEPAVRPVDEQTRTGAGIVQHCYPLCPHARRAVRCRRPRSPSSHRASPDRWRAYVEDDGQAAGVHKCADRQRSGSAPRHCIEGDARAAAGERERAADVPGSATSVRTAAFALAAAGRSLRRRRPVRRSSRCRVLRQPVGDGPGPRRTRYGCGCWAAER